jgi:predicted RNA-binding protein
MCLSTVYRTDASVPENMLAEYVTEVSASGGTLLFKDITGSEIAVDGRIEKIDLIKNIIVVG